MKLTRLELLGFKSFYNRTVFNFSEGITALVGPNGCGKSNIVDAVIWVLGERGTKSLRVKEMGDVIFHGSNGRRPINMAEVTLGLASGDSEYAVRRRVYRDGTNEYYINDKQVRLKDIQDFFLGTGLGLYSYAVVEQGNIEYFMQMKPQERRTLIEEASGITRFQEKKKEAFSRMDEVRANLERVDDLNAEVARNLKKAEEEWERLRTYNELRERLSRIEMAMLAEGLRKTRKRLRTVEEREVELKGLAEKGEESKKAIRQRIEAKDGEIELADRVLRQMELDIAAGEKDIESRVLELRYLEEERSRLQKSGRELEAADEAHGRKAAALEEELRKTLDDAGLEAKGVEKEEALSAEVAARREELKGRIEAQSRAVEEERGRLFAGVSALTDIRNSIAEAERITREREARARRRSEEEAVAEKDLARLREKVDALGIRLAAERQEEKEAVDEEKQRSLDVAGAVEAREAARIRREHLRGELRSKEDFLRKLKGDEKVAPAPALPFRRLIDGLSVPKELEALTERVLAAEMEYHVLDGEWGSMAAKAEEYEENFVFFHEGGLFHADGGEIQVRLTPVGSVSEALERIDRGEQGVFVTPNAWIDSRGFIRRRGGDSSVSLSRYREGKRLEKEIGLLSTDLKTLDDALRDLDDAYGRAEGALAHARSRRSEAEGRRALTEKEILVLATETKALEQKLTDLRTPVDLADQAPPPSMEELLEARNSAEKEKVRSEERLRLLKEELERQRVDFEAVGAEYHEITIALERRRAALKRFEDEAERCRKAIEALEEERKARAVKKEETRGAVALVDRKIAELEESCQRLGKSKDALVARFEELKQGFGNLHEERSALQEELRQADEEQEKVRARREALDKEKIVLEEKKEALIERLRKEYNVADIGGLLQEREAFTESQREEAAQLLASVGEVNFRAEREYKELKERLDFVGKQKADLEQAMASLKETIGKIDILSRDLFIETFDRVNQSFQRFTQALFKGGKGSLALNEETNGIDLYVQPPGKRVTRMELLSGGEKALISLSFLLALMDTKASPFAFMDEIDAPLDDANLMSLLEIIKGISRKTMIVLITHNRLTMESSDTVYGITMEEDGISKTISIKL